jgi:catechol 2,3-dioxygenase-like lactoylglutathione lyase family enzyme
MATNLGRRILPCLLVADMRQSLDFYVEKLGFTQTGYFPIASDPIRTEVRRDDVAIILFTETLHSSVERPSFTGALYVYPESVNEFADELRGKVALEWEPHGTEFGTREFAIRDPNGYLLIFAEPA